MEEKSKVDRLRDDLAELRKKRIKITMEKGFAAEENKDLRENFAYDYWVQQEEVINARIGTVIELIGELTKKNTKPKWEKPKPIQRTGIEKHKWL